MIYDLRKNHSEIFERIVRNRSGLLFRVRFVVVKRNGVLRGKVISITPIVALQKGSKIYDLRFKNKKQYFLQGYTEEIAYNQSGVLLTRIRSPYFSIFEFLTPIKIRAPSSHKI